MRTLLLFLCCFSFFGVLQAQYEVTKVMGTVYVKNKLLKAEDSIKETDSLRFTSPNDLVCVLHLGKGQFKLSPKKDKKVKGEFLLALRDAIVPPNQNKEAATRTYKPNGSLTFNDQYDLKSFFREQVFFIEPAKFWVDANYFPLDSTHFFMIRHQLEDGWVGKALPHADQTFELGAAVLQFQGKVLDVNSIQRSELYYVDRASNKEQYLGHFQLQFVSSQIVKEDLMRLQKKVGKMPSEQFLQKYAMPFLNLWYGNTHPESIIKLVAQMPTN